jgi:phage gp46-like protein
MSTQQGDVSLFQTSDDGDIAVDGGVVVMDSGLQTAAYLSLFGGNRDDNGLPGNSLSWWGNIGEDLEYRSETQHLVEQLPLSLSNLAKIEDAVKRDLKWMVNQTVASSVSAEASIPARNTLQLLVRINAQGKESQFKFVQNWKSATR